MKHAFVVTLEYSDEETVTAQMAAKALRKAAKSAAVEIISVDDAVREDFSASPTIKKTLTPVNVKLISIGEQ